MDTESCEVCGMYIVPGIPVCPECNYLYDDNTALAIDDDDE
jgi:uncharacterized OB-fold protein